ncbi:MAG: hypothetical protein ACK5MA_10770 [Parachlamydiaceae bacterium]
MPVIQTEGCCLCETQGAKLFWFSAISCSAHVKCYDQIKPLAEKVMETIDASFKEPHQKVVVHRRVLAEVRRACGSESLCTFLEKKGSDALRSLFDSIKIDVPQSRL